MHSSLFPYIKLNTWLGERYSWTHDDWTDLLEQLESAGFSSLTGDSDARMRIGAYLEEKRDALQNLNPKQMRK